MDFTILLALSSPKESFLWKKKNFAMRNLSKKKPENS